MVLQQAIRIKTSCLKSNRGTSWPWFVIFSQAITYHRSSTTFLSKWPHRYPTTCLFSLRMANRPPRMNQNMEPNHTGATLCICSPFVTSVETGTAINSGPLPTVNPSWGYALATIPKVMDSCYTYQPQKNLWAQQNTAWTRLYHLVPSLVIPMTEILVSIYITPPPIPPIYHHMKNKNRYTSKQNKCKNIRRKSTHQLLRRRWTRHNSNSPQPRYHASWATVCNQH